MQTTGVLPPKRREIRRDKLQRGVSEGAGSFPKGIERVSTPPKGARRGLLSGAALKTGYLPRNDLLDQAINRSMAAVFLILLSPVILVIAGLQKLTSRGPVFYCGWRLGKDGKRFCVYKFRTLSEDAAQLTRDRILPRQNTTETPLGSYLRKTRLDEIPQLFNILRGEMVFMGPRPVRPELEWLYKAEIDRYDIRFRVRPGLVGLSQALMTHGTPKVLRARFNRMCCRTHVRYPAMIGFVLYVGFCVVRKSLAAGLAELGARLRPMPDHGWLRSGFSRPKRSWAELSVGNEVIQAAICGMSEEVIQLVSARPISKGEYVLTLTRRRRSRRNFHLRVAASIEMVTPVGLGENGFVSYATYTPRTKAAHHFIERYFLQSAVIPA